MLKNIIGFFARFLPPFVREKFEESISLRKVTGNTIWLILDNVFRMALAVFVLGWLARYLGPSNFGLLNYAIALVALGASLATFGLDGVIVNEIVKKHETRSLVLGNSLLIRFIGASIMFISVCLISIFALNNERSTTYLIAIVALGEGLRIFDVIDHWFQSQLRSKYVAITRSASFILASVLRIILIATNAPLQSFAWAIVVEAFLMSSGFIIVYHVTGERLHKWKVQFKMFLYILKQSYPLAIASALIMVYMRIDQIMLKQMMGEAEVGIYSAAVRIIEMWYFIPIAIAGSVFPAIIETKKYNEELYYTRLKQIYGLLTYFAIGVCAAITIFAPLAVSILYGEEYARSASVLAISAWSGVFISQGVARGKWLLVENLQQYSIWYIAGAAVINIVLNYFFIQIWGSQGAALATVISQFSAVILIPAFFTPTRKSSIHILRSFLFIFDILKVLRQNKNRLDS